MMKKSILLLSLLLACGSLGAQTSTSWGARASVEANYKIRKGLHLTVEEELRVDGKGLDGVRTTAGVTYKPFKGLKLGAGYTLINSYKPKKATFNYPRHRFFADVTGSLRAGDFQFSLKERLQLTHRTGSFNVYQNTPNALALKSRLMLKYKGWKAVEPYAAFELRTALNEPWGTADSSLTLYDEDDGTPYFPYTPTGYTHLYNNRYRGILGAELSLAKYHSLKPYLLVDYRTDYELDTSTDGTQYFSGGYVNSVKISAGLSYTFSF